MSFRNSLTPASPLQRARVSKISVREHNHLDALLAEAELFEHGRRLKEVSDFNPSHLYADELQVAGPVQRWV